MAPLMSGIILGSRYDSFLVVLLNVAPLFLASNVEAPVYYLLEGSDPNLPTNIPKSIKLNMFVSKTPPELAKSPATVTYQLELDS